MRAVYFLVFSLFVFVFPAVSGAVTIPGRTGNASALPKKTEEEKKVSARRVFSSQLKHVEQAEKLDEIYQSAEVFLIDASKINFIHQKNLMERMDARKFKYTRKLSEFKPGLELAMRDLNKTHKDFQSYIKKIDDDFAALRSEFSDEEKDVMRLWNAKIGELNKFSENYFKSQGRYLNEYNSLVSFVIGKSGSYYFDGNSTKIAFYKVEDYTFFAEGIDRLNKITFDQRRVLEKIRPPETIE